MNKNLVIVVVLGLLVVISAVQAFQLAQLKTDINAGSLSLGTAKSSTSISTGQSTLPASLDQLDTMVGGC